MATGEIEEGFGGRTAVGQIGPEQAFHGIWAIVPRNITEQFATDAGIAAGTAADKQVEAFDRVSVVAPVDLAGDEPDVADIVLGAGVVAAGQVNVDRRVDLQPALDMGDDG